MPLHQSVDDVIRIKSERDQAEIRYVQARDRLYNDLVNSTLDSYSHDGFTFTRREFREASRVSPHKLKELFILAPDIPQEIKNRLLREAIVDTETAPGIAVYPPRG